MPNEANMEIREPTTSPAPDRPSLIEVTELTKKFNEVTAIDRISFSLFQGELFGFLGPNGAGKTTTINILTGLARPDSGTIRIRSEGGPASDRGRAG
jgi:ABC-2 type transport system ATP-binding protein